jgi:hypothetical protein
MTDIDCNNVVSMVVMMLQIIANRVWWILCWKGGRFAVLFDFPKQCGSLSGHVSYLRDVEHAHQKSHLSTSSQELAFDP